jgi:hypothetical protein
MKVLIIPEDQELDRYIVQPVVDALFADLSLSAQVSVLPEPRLRGTSQALDPVALKNIIHDNPMIDLFLLLIDRDGNRERNEAKAEARVSEHPGKLLACLAVEEVEVWLLALYRNRIELSWAEVRSNWDPKEAYAEPLLEQLGSFGPGKGRKRAMQALKGQLRKLLSLCPELEQLQKDILRWQRTRERSG